MMRVKKKLTALIEWRRQIFKPLILQIPNSEWLYMLKEETRNSLMIEGIFASENDLEATLIGKYKASDIAFLRHTLLPPKCVVLAWALSLI